MTKTVLNDRPQSSKCRMTILSQNFDVLHVLLTTATAAAVVAAAAVAAAVVAASVLTLTSAPALHLSYLKQFFFYFWGRNQWQGLNSSNPVRNSISVRAPLLTNGTKVEHSQLLAWRFYLKTFSARFFSQNIFNGPTSASFCLFSVFSNKQYNFYNK